MMLLLGLVLLLARVFGRVAVRLGAPAVVGELLAGILLGPSALGALWPDWWSWCEGAGGAGSLRALGAVGLVLLLLVAGLETDLQLVLRRRRAVLLIGVSAFLLPFVAGAGLGLVLPAGLHGVEASSWSFAVLMGVATAIASVPVIAKVLLELRATRRDVSQLILSVAMLVDMLAWVALSMGSDAGGAGGWLRPVVATAGFVLVGALAGPWLVRQLVGSMERLSPSASMQLTTALALGFGMAGCASWLGLEPILGAFGAGLLLAGVPRFRATTTRELERWVDGLFGPLFFALTGMRVDVGALTGAEAVGALVALLVVRLVSRQVAVSLAGRWSGVERPERRALAMAISTEGAMGLVVATVGMEHGLLSESMFAALVVLAVITTVVPPILLRGLVGAVPVSESERRRMAWESSDDEGFGSSLRRVLIPTRGGPNVQGVLALLSLVARRKMEVVGLEVLGPTAPASGTFAALRTTLDRRFMGSSLIGLAWRSVVSSDGAAAILREASAGYDLLVVGAPVEQADGLANPLVGEVVQQSPCAVMVFRASRTAPEEGTSWRPMTLLVPTVGTAACRRAVDFAAAVSVRLSARLVILHVVEATASEQVLADGARLASLRDLGDRLVDGHVERALGVGAPAEALVVVAASVEEAVLRTVREQGVELLVFGSNLRAVEGRAYYGRVVDLAFREAPSAVLVMG
jgi:Kef-type K+ transport system membrane component KefB